MPQIRGWRFVIETGATPTFSKFYAVSDCASATLRLGRTVHVYILYLIQKQPSCKTSMRPPRRPLWKKMWNPRWRPRNGWDGRLIAKILIKKFRQICVSFSTFHYDSAPNSLELSLLKFLLLAYRHSHFLAAIFDLTSFFHNGLLGGCTLFYSWAVFRLDFASFCNWILQSWHIAINGWCYLSFFFM